MTPPLPVRPRELPLAIVGLFASLAYAAVWPTLGMSRDRVNDDAVFGFLVTSPCILLAWLPPVAYRGLGFAAWGGFILGLATTYSFVMNDWTSPVPAGLQGCGCWLMLGASVRYLKWLGRSVGRLGPHRAAYLRSRNRTVFMAGLVVFMLALTGMLIQKQSPADHRAFVEFELFTLAGLAAMLGMTLLFRPGFELTLEPFIRLMYRIRGVGPGRAKIPAFGPCLMVANHAAWLDPLFLEKYIPRPTTFMMISGFYEVPILRPLLKYIFRVIVVADRSVRRETPEIDVAVSRLDDGACVVMFPEGFLRRKEDVPIRRFGRGAWQILQARPKTPVVACWIEGSWGSYFSYSSGPPTRNKRIDRRRPISISYSSPFMVPTEILEDQLMTRQFLMNKVQQTRTLLGLPPLPEVRLAQSYEESDDECRIDGADDSNH